MFLGVSTESRYMYLVTIRNVWWVLISVIVAGYEGLLMYVILNA